MQLTPDWTTMVTPKDFSDEFGHPFRGPGLYFKDQDFLIVVPVPPEAPATRENVWYVDQPKGTLYRVHVYNVPFEKTIFGAVNTPPTRT